MKYNEYPVLLIGLFLLNLIAQGSSGADAAYPSPVHDVRIRDPFVYAHRESRTYFMYASAAKPNPTNSAVVERGVMVYRSKDLTNWSLPQMVFRRPENFWGGNEIWAPEVHRFGNRFYLFVTFNGREGGRGTQIFRSSSPEGPFEIFSDDANTPVEQTCLDATPWIDADGSHWLVYCHEWIQIGNGAMKAVRMKSDWSMREGQPVELFRASQAPWVKALAPSPARPGTNNYVTDGPWFHRFKDGKLWMLWSSFGAKGYSVGIAESENGRLDGKWRHHAEPLFASDGGHCMVFRTFENQLKLVLHQPNGGGRERARFYDIMDTGNALAVRRPDAPAGYLFAHMTEPEYGRLRYSVSTDGLHWRLLNKGNRIISDYIGHPDITLGHDGRYYLLGNAPDRLTVRLWTSTNLIRWETVRDFMPRLGVLPEFKGPGGYHGAPKMFYDKASKQYLLTWHSSINIGHPTDTEGLWRGMRTLYVLSKDLVTFTDPQRLFPWEVATIDTIVRPDNGRYYAIVKDERYPSFDWPTGKTIRMASAKEMLGPYSELSLPLSPNFREAPMLIERPDGAGWYLYYEQYPGRSYGLSTASSLNGPWHEISWGDFSIPENARHGCMIPLSKERLDELSQGWN